MSIHYIYITDHCVSDVITPYTPLVTAIHRHSVFRTGASDGYDMHPFTLPPGRPRCSPWRSAVARLPSVMDLFVTGNSASRRLGAWRRRVWECSRYTWWNSLRYCNSAGSTVSRERARDRRGDGIRESKTRLCAGHMSVQNKTDVDVMLNLAGTFVFEYSKELWSRRFVYDMYYVMTPRWRYNGVKRTPNRRNVMVSHVHSLPVDTHRADGEQALSFDLIPFQSR